MKLIFNKKYNEHKSRENSQETLNKIQEIIDRYLVSIV